MGYDPLQIDEIPYTVRTRGQRKNADTSGTDDNIPTSVSDLLFNATVTTITGKLVSADGSQAGSQAAVKLVSVTTDITGLIIESVGTTKSQEVSQFDGTFTLYADAVGTYVVSITMDNDLNYGSGVFNGAAIVAASRSQVAPEGIITIIDLSTAFVTPADIPVPTLGAGNSVGYLTGDAGAGSIPVDIRIGGVGGTNNLNDMVTTRTRGDGSFKLTLPVETYSRVRFRGSVDVNCSDVIITDAMETTLTTSCN